MDENGRPPVPKATSVKSVTDETEVSFNDDQVEGWLVKTVQDVGMFQKSKFLKRWFVLNSGAATLTQCEGPDDKCGTAIEFRRNNLVHVETELSREIPESTQAWSGSKKSVFSDLTLPDVRREPIGLCFADGSAHLLWARPGKDFKVWSRALKRFVS